MTACGGFHRVPFVIALGAASCTSEPMDPTAATSTDSATTASTTSTESASSGTSTPTEGTASNGVTSQGEADETLGAGDSTGSDSTGQDDEDTTGIDPLDHLVFVTSERYRGNLMGLMGADAECERLASLARIDHGRAWIAVLAAYETHVDTRVTISRPVRNIQGELIAADETSFWNEDLGAPLLTEQGEVPPSWDPVRGWSVTWAATPHLSCGDWQNDSAGAYGDVAITEPGEWIFGSGGGGGDNLPCDAELPYLCISQ